MSEQYPGGFITNLFKPFKMQRCPEGKPVEVEGVWHMTWTVRDATPEEIEQAKKPIDPMRM